MSPSAVSLPEPMLPTPYRIEGVQSETANGGVFTWRLAPVAGSVVGFDPGQFNMLYCFGIGEVPISISGATESGELLHTIRAVGGVTRSMRSFRPGDTVGLRGPFGSHWPVEEARGKDLIIVAGGIGLAPLRPIVYTVLNRRSEFNRVLLLCGARHPRDLLYRRELEGWGNGTGLTIELTVDQSTPDWNGHIGVVTKLIARSQFDPDNALAVVCGPEVMMRFTVLELHKQGLADEAIYLSMERNMKCALGYCGHCQYGPHLVCRDGPVFRFDRIKPIFHLREI